MWLVRDGEVLATAELAATRRERARGLLGRRGYEGALVFRKVRQVHTVGMRFTIDVAFCDGRGRVLRMVTMRPWRVSPRRLEVRPRDRGRGRCVRALGPPGRRPRRREGMRCRCPSS